MLPYASPLPDPALPPILRSLSPAVRAVCGVLMLVLGVQAWLIGSTYYGSVRQRETLLVTFVLVCIPPINRVVRHALAAIDAAVPRRPWTWAFACTIVAIVYFYVTARMQGRPFVPRIHDEWQFLLQARFLANGRLWMPPHAIADFFDTFYVLRKPVYAPQSFPGWPLMVVPSLWLGLPFWTTPLLVTAIVLLLVFRLVLDALGGVAAVTSVLLFASLWGIRCFSLVAMAHTPAMCLGVASIFFYWQWRRSGRRGWAIGIGIASGWAAITRPIDALCYAIPLGLVMAVDFARVLRATPRSARAVASVAALVIAGASPFLALQLAFNKGVTGTFTETPFHLYNSIDQPGLDFVNEAASQNLRPETTLPQKISHYDHFIAPSMKRYRSQTFIERVRTIVKDALIPTVIPHPLTLALIPAALLMLGPNRLWLLAAPMAIYVIGYAFYPISGAHYTTSVAAAGVALMLLGVEGVRGSFGRRGEAARVIALAWLAALAFLSMPPMDPLVFDEMILPRDIAQVERTIATVPPRSIVLFVPDIGGSSSEEPVYNLDVLWPDDAPVIRAHDLGQRNRELLDYYAARQPDRTVYRYDRPHDKLARLGNVVDLAREAATRPAD